MPYRKYLKDWGSPLESVTSRKVMVIESSLELHSTVPSSAGSLSPTTSITRQWKVLALHPFLDQLKSRSLQLLYMFQKGCRLAWLTVFPDLLPVALHQLYVVHQLLLA